MLQEHKYFNYYLQKLLLRFIENELKINGILAILFKI